MPENYLVFSDPDKSTWNDIPNIYDREYICEWPAEQCIVPLADLVSWWPGDGDADDIYDGNNGTPQNGATFGAGMVDQAFLFDGTDDFVDAGNASNLQVSSGDFTVDAWVLFHELQRPPGVGSAPQGDMSLVDKMNPSGINTDGWRIFKQDDNSFFFCLGLGTENGCTHGGLTTVRSTTLVTTDTLDTWFHIAAVKAGNTISIYVNGAMEDTKTLGTSFTDTNAANLLLGTNDLEGAFLDGQLDEIEIYNRALSTTEIQDIFYSFSAGKCKVTTVAIDIKPGSFPNSINPRSEGVIPVAILTTEDFDATTVDPLSVEFGPSGATESHGRGHIEDVDGDGDMDLVLHFKTQETGIRCGDTTASLRGRTMDFPVFSTDFEAGLSSEFSGYGSLTATQGYSAFGFGDTFLRNDSLPAESTILALSGLPAHDRISLNFLSGMIDSWDGLFGAELWGPDFFNVTVDGVWIFSETIHQGNQIDPSGRQSYIPPSGVVLSFSTDLGFNSTWKDIAYNMGLDPTFDNIPHSASTLEIEWFAGGGGWQGGWDESWAIDNIEVLVFQEVGGSDLINTVGCE